MHNSWSRLTEILKILKHAPSVCDMFSGSIEDIFLVFVGGNSITSGSRDEGQLNKPRTYSESKKISVLLEFMGLLQKTRGKQSCPRRDEISGAFEYLLTEPEPRIQTAAVDFLVR